MGFLSSRQIKSFKGHVSAGLILGGVDPVGSHVIQIHPYGSTANLPYTTMGSGSLAAMSVLEDSWRPGLNEEQVIKCIICSILCTPNIVRYIQGVLLLGELNNNY